MKLRGKNTALRPDAQAFDEIRMTTVMRKKDFCRAGHETEPHDHNVYRHFCEEHKRRGDCGLDDADVNYVLVQ